MNIELIKFQLKIKMPEEQDIKDNEQDIDESLEESQEIDEESQEIDEESQEIDEESQEPLEDIIEETPTADYPVLETSRAIERWPSSQPSPSLETARPITQQPQLETELADTPSNQTQGEEETKVYTAQNYSTDTYQPTKLGYPDIEPQLPSLNPTSDFQFKPVIPGEVRTADSWHSQKFTSNEAPKQYQPKSPGTKRDRRRF